MRAGRRLNPLPRYKGVWAAGLTALPALLALGTAAPALAAVPAHHKVATPPPVHYQQVSNTATCGADSFCTVTVTCPRGTLVTGGGITTNTFISSGVYVYETAPVNSTTWRGTIRNATQSTFPVTVKAVCARSQGF
ncbi:hypothetical protein GCM10010510_24820 [Streptomyces anandii JCM 4720]|nr:hypothetical protein GCM10010510_24820 [Streptomyces anandii JCM 4720]